ncbi:hypothetical protein PP544_21765, partial [Mycobacteroides abscessus]|nr:hypothetical protein [Mycobacteroides abscessus]
VAPASKPEAAKPEPAQPDLAAAARETAAQAKSTVDSAPPPIPGPAPEQGRQSPNLKIAVGALAAILALLLLRRRRRREDSVESE